MAFGDYFVQVEPGDQIVTTYRAKRAAPESGRSMDLDQAEPFRIAVGIDLFVQGIGSQLAAASQRAHSEVAALLLAHEIFHLTELERMSRCHVPFGEHFSGFAAAIDPTMPKLKRLAALELAGQYKMARPSLSGVPQPKHTLTAWRAADIAAEACADMQALLFVRRMPVGAAALEAALLALRFAQEAAAGIAPLDSQGQIGPVDYQIGAFLQATLPIANAMAGPAAARDAAWASAFQAALGDPFLRPEARAAIATSNAPVVETAAKKGRWSLFQKAKP